MSFIKVSLALVVLLFVSTQLTVAQKCYTQKCDWSYPPKPDSDRNCGLVTVQGYFGNTTYRKYGCQYDDGSGDPVYYQVTGYNGGNPLDKHNYNVTSVNCCIIGDYDVVYGKEGQEECPVGSQTSSFQTLLVTPYCKDTFFGAVSCRLTCASLECMNQPGKGCYSGFQVNCTAVDVSGNGISCTEDYPYLAGLPDNGRVTCCAVTATS